jgi:pilus assembly protein CpaE
VVVVVADEPLARPLATIQTLSQGIPPWTVLALVAQFDAEVFRKAVLAGAADVLLRTAPPEELRKALVNVRRIDLSRRAAPTAGRDTPAGTIISIVGVKGGIGKTTIAINLAISLARETRASTALVDLDLPFGDVALMLDIHPERDILHAVQDDVLSDPDRLQAQMIPGPDGVRILAAPPHPAPGPLGASVHGHQVARLLERLASIHDFVVVDTPPGVHELLAATLDVAALALVVTTPEVPCLHRTQAFLQMMRGLDYPMERMQVVLNRYNSKTGVKDSETEEVLQTPITWKVANDHAAMKGAALGQPAATSAPDTELATSIRRIARQLGGLSEERRPRGWRAWLPHAAIP